MTGGDDPGPTPALPDLGGLLAGFERLQDAQTADYEGTAGGGAVRVSASGAMEFRSVTIDPDAVAAGDVELLQDLVLAALNHLAANIAEQMAEVQRAAMGGVDLAGLGGLFGPGPGPGAGAAPDLAPPERPGS